MQADCPVALSPLDENRRLAALRALEILDSEPETDFDALTAWRRTPWARPSPSSA